MTCPYKGESKAAARILLQGSSGQEVEAGNDWVVVVVVAREPQNVAQDFT